MGEIIIFLILLLLSAIEAKFPFMLFPSLFLTVYIVWVIKTNLRVSNILFISFILGICLDALDTSHVWLYPFFMPIMAEVMIQVKQRVNLTRSFVRIIVFTTFVLILFLPILFYYNIPVSIIFFRSLLTGLLIEGVLVLLWKGELE